MMPGQAARDRSFSAFLAGMRGEWQDTQVLPKQALCSQYFLLTTSLCDLACLCQKIQADGTGACSPATHRASCVRACAHMCRHVPCMCSTSNEMWCVPLRQIWQACEAAGEAHLAAVGAHESSSEDEEEGRSPKRRPMCPAAEDAVQLVHISATASAHA